MKKLLVVLMVAMRMRPPNAVIARIMRLNPRRSFVLALVGLVLPMVALSAAPQALMTEYRVDPVGIDVERPRLLWEQKSIANRVRLPLFFSCRFSSLSPFSQCRSDS